MLQTRNNDTNILDENLIDDLRPNPTQNNSQQYLCNVCLCISIGLMSFGMGMITHTQFFTHCDCVCDGSL